MSCTTTSYWGGGESPLFREWFANPREAPLRGTWAGPWDPNDCWLCRSVRLMVDVPLVIGIVGDIDVDAGKSGAVSALSWYGRLEGKFQLALGKFACRVRITSSSSRSKCENQCRRESWARKPLPLWRSSSMTIQTSHSGRSYARRSGNGCESLDCPASLSNLKWQFC